MNYLTEKEGKFYLHNKILMWIGRASALSIIIGYFCFFFVIHVGFSRITTSSLEVSLIFFLIAIVPAFFFLFIGSRVTIFSEEGIDTYRDFIFFKFWKRHLDAGEYELQESYNYNRRIDDIEIIIGGKRQIIYSYWLIGSTEGVMSQVDDALANFTTYTKKGFSEAYGYTRCPKCKGYMVKMDGKCPKCGYRSEATVITGVTESKPAAKTVDNDFPLINKIGESTGGWKSVKLSNCEYDNSVNGIHCFDKFDKCKATVYLHTNGIRIACSSELLIITFKQIRRMSYVSNIQQGSEYEYNLKIEYFDLYEHRERDILIACKTMDNDFIEKYETERDANHTPVGEEFITCNLMDENGEYSKEKATEAYSILGLARTANELKHLNVEGKSEMQLLLELRGNAKDTEQKKGCKYHALVVLTVIMCVIMALIYITRIVNFFTN